ncbi:MAG: hypothetical protein QM820_28385 [Minicystis sp.]
MPTKTESHSTGSPQRPLATLAKEVGKADPALLAAHLAGTSDAELVDVGRNILSARIVTDSSRLYNQAWDWWKQARTEQKKRLRGFSTKLLALAVHQALALEALDAAHAGNTKGAAASRDKSERTAEAIFNEALALRDQADSALHDVAGHDSALLAEADAARGTAGDGDELAAGLLGFAKLLKAWLKKGKTDKALRGRLELAELDAGYATELEEGAAKVKDATAAAKKRPAGGKVTQGELDRADGINVLLLGQIIRAFDTAHDRDPTIPRLVPIATRRQFARSGKKKTVEGKAGKDKPVEAKAEGEKTGNGKAEDGETSKAEDGEK